MRVTMIGHSTVLLEGASTRLITDPYFGTIGHIAYSRTRPPAGRREQFRDVDGVLVSHAHWDHTDRKYLRGLAPSIPILAPAGRSLVLRLKGARNVAPMRPWQSRRIDEAVVTAVPAVHIARTVGFVVEMDRLTVYFAGDTYHRPFMKEIARRFRVDVAMIPVTTFRIPPTMGERGAAAAVRDLRPGKVIPIHLGVLPRSPLLRTRQSPRGFERRLREAGLESIVIHLAEGERWDSSGESTESKLAAQHAAHATPRAAVPTPAG